MNDTELDRLLDIWEAPAPAQSMRDGLRARFPKHARMRFTRPLKWVLAGLCSLGLTLAVAQSSENHGNALLRFADYVHSQTAIMVDAHRTVFIIAEIKRSEPKVYIDGQPAAPLEHGNLGSLRVRIPGDGAYAVTVFRYMKQIEAGGHLTGWTEAGNFHGNVLEFEAGGRQVRIECNQSVIDGERPVYVMRAPEQ